jgi:hypothetical protein
VPVTRDDIQVRLEELQCLGLLHHVNHAYPFLDNTELYQVDTAALARIQAVIAENGLTKKQMQKDAEEEDRTVFIRVKEDTAKDPHYRLSEIFDAAVVSTMSSPRFKQRMGISLLVAPPGLQRDDQPQSLCNRAFFI